MRYLVVTLADTGPKHDPFASREEALRAANIARGEGLTSHVFQVVSGKWEKIL